MGFQKCNSATTFSLQPISVKILIRTHHLFLTELIKNKEQLMLNPMKYKIDRKNRCLIISHRERFLPNPAKV